jgi:hypothetical protein
VSVLRDFCGEKKKREEKMEHRQKNIEAKTGKFSSWKRKSSALLTAVEREKSSA